MDTDIQTGLSGIEPWALRHHKVLFLGRLCACRPPLVAIRKPLFPDPISLVASDYLSIDSPRDLIGDRGALSVYNSQAPLPGAPLRSPPLPPSVLSSVRTGHR